MASPGPKLHDIAAEWRAARRVYPIYAAVLKRFDLGVEPCRVLISPIDRSDDESLASLREWLAKMDELCTALHLRQTLQAASIGTEASLKALAQRYLAKEDGLDAYRDRVDFLLVQYFCQFAPADMHQREPKLEDVAKVLEPIIGEASLRVPAWATQVELLLVRLAQCATLKDLAKEGILPQGRKLKEQAGAMYFGSGVMVAFTRYNFLVRRAFVRLMSADLEAIRSALSELERRKVDVVDAVSAGLGAEEALATIRKECRDWKKIYLADYAGGGAFAKIIALREAVATALANAPEPQPEPVVEPEPVVNATEPESLPEFNVATHQGATPVFADEAADFAAFAKELDLAVSENMVSAESHPATEVANGIVDNPRKPIAGSEGAAASVASAQPRPEALRVGKPAEVASTAPLPKAELVTKEGVAVAAPMPIKASVPVVVAPKPQVAEVAKSEAAETPMPQRLDVIASELVDDADGLDVDLTFPLPDALEKIAEQLFKAELQKVHLAVANVTLGSTRILLSSWEVEAFLRGGDDLADTLQIATTARAVLTEALDRRKRTGSAPDLRAVLAMAHAEAGALQERIAQARDAKNVDAAVNLSATARRMIGLMDEAEAILRDGSQGRTQ